MKIEREKAKTQRLNDLNDAISTLTTFFDHLKAAKFFNETEKNFQTQEQQLLELRLTDQVNPTGIPKLEFLNAETFSS